MLDDFTEFLSILAESPENNQASNTSLTYGSRTTQQLSLVRENQQLIVLDQDQNLYDYTSRLKLQSPNNPPFTGPIEVTNIIQPNLPEVTEQTSSTGKHQWVISKLWEATHNTKHCTMRNNTNEGIITQIASQAITNIHFPTNSTEEEKQKLINFNKETLKLFFNSAQELEEKKIGSSHVAVSLRAKHLGIQTNNPPILLKSMGEVLLSPAAYSLEHHFNSGNQSIWENLAGIPVHRAQGVLSHLSTNFLQIDEVYREMATGPEFNLPSSVNAAQVDSILNFVTRNNQRVLGRITESFNSIRTSTSNRVRYKHIGGGVFIVLFTSGLVIYLKMPDSFKLITVDGGKSTSGEVGRAVGEGGGNIGTSIKDTLFKIIKALSSTR